jgi:AraC family transcriptional regulator
MDMGAAPRIATPLHEPPRVSVRLVVDPPGRVETPAQAKHYVAIHVGRSVFMSCHRGGFSHRGVGIHGDIDIIPSGTPCVWEPKETDTALTLGISPRLVAFAAKESGTYSERLEILNRFQIRDQRIEHIGWALKAEMEAGNPAGAVFNESAAMALASCLVRSHGSIARTAHGPSPTLAGRKLRNVLSYIEDNLDRNVSLEELAGVAGLSASHFKASFRRSMGTPVHQYLIRRRVERATVLLRDGALSIVEIAQATGFAHSSHLASHMRRLLGCSPKSIRADR